MTDKKEPALSEFHRQEIERAIDGFHGPATAEILKRALAAEGLGSSPASQVEELWRQHLYPNFDAETFRRYLADTTAEGWDDTRKEVAALRSILAEVSSPARPEVEQEIVKLFTGAVEWLSRGACIECGAEPGCNVDCEWCRWMHESKTALSALAEGAASTAPPALEPPR